MEMVFRGESLLVDSVTVEQIAGWRGFPEGTAPRALADVAIERRIAGCRVATTASRARAETTLAALSWHLGRDGAPATEGGYA